MTVGEVIRKARLHHRAFDRDTHPDRVCLSFLSTRHRLAYLALAHAMRDRLSQARAVASVISGTLVGVDANGVLYQVATEDDGYLVGIDANGFLYTVGDPFALDPYSGGFPLPVNAIEIIHIYANMEDGTRVPVTWVPQAQMGKLTGLGGLVAIVNAWRLVPVKNPTTLTTSWDDVTSVTIHWITDPVEFTALTDELLVPASYALVLEQDLVAFLAARQAALTPDAFPAALVTQYQTMAAESQAIISSRATLDHQQVRQTQSARCR